MKIMLIVPAPDYRRKLLYRAGNYFYGPSSAITGPLILGAILKQRGHDVEVYQELDRDFDLQVMKRFDLIGIYTITSNSGRAYALADTARKKFNKRVIIGGMHATALPNEALMHADQVIVGEAENVITDVVEQRLTSPVVYAGHVTDIDAQPFPDYSILRSKCSAANILTTRGCPYRCSFCTTSRMFSPYRERSIDSVIDEIRLYKKMGFRCLNFQDDNLTANKKRVKDLLRRMISENLIFSESFFFGRIDLADDDELLGLLRDANLTRVLIGFESLNQNSHNIINKRLNVEDIFRLSSKLSSHGIKLIASLVLGLDSDNRDDIAKAVDHCISINAYQLQPAILTPFPGTDIYSQLTAENRIFEKNWEFYDMMNVVFSPKNFTPEELQHEFFLSLKRFYSLGSLYRIFRSYGVEAVIRRAGMWMIFSVSYIYYLTVRTLFKGSLYAKQRSFKRFHDVPERVTVSGRKQVPIIDESLLLGGADKGLDYSILPD